MKTAFILSLVFHVMLIALLGLKDHAVIPTLEPVSIAVNLVPVSAPQREEPESKSSDVQASNFEEEKKTSDKARLASMEQEATFEEVAPPVSAQQKAVIEGESVGEDVTKKQDKRVTVPRPFIKPGGIRTAKRPERKAQPKPALQKPEKPRVPKAEKAVTPTDIDTLLAKAASVETLPQLDMPQNGVIANAGKPIAEHTPSMGDIAYVTEQLKRYWDLPLDLSNTLTPEVLLRVRINAQGKILSVEPKEPIRLADPVYKRMYQAAERAALRANPLNLPQSLKGRSRSLTISYQR